MEENLPLVSVAMPCYNHEKYVAQAIESVLNQTYPNIEFIVADNGSLDGSYEVIKRYEGRLKKIIRLEKNDRNKCEDMLFAEAAGSYFAMMTSDDYWEPDKIELQMQAIKENPNVKLCSTWAVFADENLVPISEKSIFMQNNRSREEWIKYLIENGNCIAYASVVMETELRKKTLAELNRGYRQLGDYYIWLRLLQETDIYIVPKVLMKFRWHTSGENQNESAPSEENDIRTVNEYADILSNIMENISDDLFRKVFHGDLRNPNAKTPEEIMCEKFFVLLKLAKQRYYYQPCVEHFFHEHYRKVEENGEITGLEVSLERLYHYSVQDFYEWSGCTGIAKYMKEIKKTIDRYEPYLKYLQLLQKFCLEGKEGTQYQECIAQLKRLRMLSLPEQRQKKVLTVLAMCKKVLALQPAAVEQYHTVIEVLSVFSQGMDSVQEELSYLDWAVSKDDWAVFKELIQYGSTEQIDLTESVFPYLQVIYESLLVYAAGNQDDSEERVG